MHFDHLQVGSLVVKHEKLAITGTAGMMLVLLHADAGSADAEKFALLASVVV